MSTVRDEKISTRLHKMAAAAALLIAGAMTAGCSHPAVTPAPDTHDPTVVAPAPAAAAAPGVPAAAPSPMSPGDQEEMKQKQNENKGTAPPP